MNNVFLRPFRFHFFKNVKGVDGIYLMSISLEPGVRDKFVRGSTQVLVNFHSYSRLMGKVAEL